MYFCFCQWCWMYSFSFWTKRMDSWLVWSTWTLGPEWRHSKSFELDHGFDPKETTYHIPLQGFPTFMLCGNLIPSSLEPKYRQKIKSLEPNMLEKKMSLWIGFYTTTHKRFSRELNHINSYCIPNSLKNLLYFPLISLYSSSLFLSTIFLPINQT